ncbi:MAG: asparagine synthase (glutamine-hydrolyzing) [Alphaproteobacteria bacterium 16-39-46]|nr:MAG: asparagine synthase (glutamine-hydrolyzing) [Alphaproteobacteria bacterium 16-39-46]OZA44518.1 MAG: asparagine synthase (glutamine-hydrolyzing) [Alphaproteobacteria bacterium 17-39-52]HQS83365.1 asparagine synthase (glutamine-hydrolyzing) [Alphaproteobacteria bacterium]HQS93052.1 asparagine synthase (glutamine-hydrolyzing) [Alphaproteobacteria bacterium]
MCGIAGIFNFNDQTVAYSQLKAMTDAIAHRGPDGEGHYIDEYVGLGHRRLAIIDLSPAGHQPMQTQDGRFTITYNGEVYNFKELRIQLEALGHQFHSHTDTEVILNAYAEWGHNCLNKFNGMFAFAIWDKKEKKLFLARDRYGIKPFYYCKADRSIIFSSEIKAIVASGLYESKLDKEGLVEYLTFQNFFTNKTLFKDVKMLMPGHYAYVDERGKFENHQYWDFNFCGSLKISEAEAIEETDRLFKQAVQRQLISDVPINAYLSGGIDSGAITRVASQFLPHMKTFTLGFDLSSASGLELSFDERAKAEHISYLAKTEHYEMVLKAGDMERCMDKYVWHLEEPRVGQSYPNYYAAKLASKFGKVVLSGVGGDELFGGYPWRYLYSDKAIKFDDFIDTYYLKWQRLLPNSLLKELLAPIWEEVQHVWTRDIFADIFKTLKKETLTSEECINYSLYLEAKTFLHGLLVVEDKLSMAHGLETRVPFLDNDLVDFSMKIPIHMKIVGNTAEADENDLVSKAQATKSGKRVLRKAVEKYLDAQIVNTKKQGFSSPDASWFRGESIEFVKKKLNSSLLVQENIFNLNFLKSYIEEHLKGEKNHRLFIWSFLNLETIFRKVFK